VHHLTVSPSFRLLQECVRHTSLAEKHNVNTETSTSNKIPNNSKAAPTSFSLFDLLDQQGASLGMLPRVTAAMVMDAHERGEQSNTADSKSSLELLEIADDIEDLSPDPETWEHIRQILYDGLVLSTDDKNSIEKRCRFLQVHISLLDICQRGHGSINNKTQYWDLTNNIIGSILSLSKDFMKKLDEFESNLLWRNKYMELYWDSVQHLITSSSHSVLNYITSCVGDERETERMVLGICLIFANESASCITAAIDCFAAWFEVWARFIPPMRMLNIVRRSGLGGIVLHRCYHRGTCNSAERLAATFHSENKRTTKADVELAHFLQSLSILRVIVYQCGSSQMAINTIFHQFINLEKQLNELSKIDTLPSFLTPKGVASTATVFKLLNEAKVDMDVGSKGDAAQFSKAIETVFKPFHDTLSSRELNNRELQALCSTSLEIYFMLKSESCRAKSK